MFFTYHPLLGLMGKIINKDLKLLHIDKEVKKVFAPMSMISCYSARNVFSYLVRVKVYP